MLERTTSSPEGIGGWLLLPLVGLIVNPLLIAHTIYREIIPVFQPDTWEALTDPASPGYHPAWSGLIWFEAIGNAILIALTVGTLYHFLTHSRRTPLLYIALLAFTALFTMGDWLIAEQIPWLAEQPDPDTRREVVRSFIRAAIWIPYFRVSRRVQNTFVR